MDIWIVCSWVCGWEKLVYFTPDLLTTRIKGEEGGELGGEVGGGKIPMDSPVCRVRK